ncbi:DUF177 domain-containing protein [Acidaminobacter sp. JC074]|uniref:YceD family protein n=1 Tax=Acidaminobacter sp. JC074 TaxID=2530199 RepID=UPI001F10EF56|nr:DUF177 domain-containing protein [Acidaminobacter sp. JC074]MCH4890275.1 DUF177 domain-containing protein [Acidaminobacter sp. JC074]
MKYDLTQLISQKVNEVEIDSILEFTKDDDLSKSESFKIAPVMVAGVVKRNGENFSLTLNYRSKWTYYCNRCLDELEYELEGEIVRSIVKERNDAEDDNVYVESAVIDLYDVIYNDIVLNLPSQVLCDENCKGLCPDCGANLNTSECTCEDEKIDPRFAKLKNLFTHD